MTNSESQENVALPKKSNKLLEKVEKFCSEYFGSYAREKLFYIPPDVSFTDHITFGVIPKFVLTKKFEKAEQLEANPSAFLLESHFHDISKVMEAVAKEFNFNPNDGVFTNSCCESLQISLNSLELDAEERLLIFSDCCATIKNIIKGTCDQYGCAFDILQVPVPLTKLSKLLDLFEECLVKCKYRAVVIEHVSPNTGILYPICKRNDVVIIIYGSYAVGHVPIDLSRMDADFYIGSFYKWYFSSRSVSLLYASKALKTNVWPLIENRTASPNESSLLTKFYFNNKCDTTDILTVRYGLEFMNHIGGLVTITEYNIKLLRWAVHHLESVWNTKAFKLTRTVRAPFMAFVRLPVCVERFFLNKYGGSQAHHQFIKYLYGSYDISGGARVLDNLLYCRITAHVYNTKKDYEMLASAVEEMNNDFRLTTYKPKQRRSNKVKKNFTEC